MEFGNQINQRRGDARLSLFQNSGYQTERETKKTLLVDISGAAAFSDFSVNLMEPLIIDRLSDVYLDSFTTWGAYVNNNARPQNTGFTLHINEFPISTNVASNQNPIATKYDSTKYGAIFIANSSSVASGQAVTHKAKKFNYVCAINPGKITTISGSILDAGTRVDPPHYDTPFDGIECRFIAEFVIVSRD